MGILDNTYIFRHAILEDCDEIMNFINDEWPKKNHILATDKSFFLYEFQNNEQLNFVVAVNRNTGLIDAIMGYIRTSQSTNVFDIWTCMWITRRKGSVPFLGLEVLKRMKDIVNYRYLIGIGTNPTTALPLVRNRENHFVFKLKHFYMLSEKHREFKIANILSPKKIVKQDTIIPQSLLVQVDNIKEISECITYATIDCIPIKDEGYINKRYFMHPIYKYSIWKIVECGKNVGIIVGKENIIDEVKILRIVDFLGKEEVLDGLYDSFHQLMEKNDYEYIDFYVSGICDTHLHNSGFILKTKDDKNIIPNYFEPFLQTNIDIYGTSTTDNVRMCKADADQDRPNYSKHNPKIE